jgi:hypothetical protein
MKNGTVGVKAVYIGAGLILAWDLVVALGQGLPIQKFRVMLERHEDSLCPLNLDLFTYYVIPAAPPSEREQLRQTSTWIHVNHDHFLKYVDQHSNHPGAEIRLLWYNSGPWGHLQEQSLKLLPPPKVPLWHPAHLGLRWQGRRLSEWLRPEWARFYGEESVNGRPAWRIDVRLPDTRSHAQPMRIWIDREREIPLQIGTLDVTYSRSSSVAFQGLVRDIDYVRDPDGLWIPQQGRLYERVRSVSRASHWRLQIDRDSIRRDTAAFPSGLFSYTTTHAFQPLPQASPVDDSNSLGPGSIIPEDIWHSPRTPEEIATLDQLRELILINEAALDTIHFHWAAHRVDNHPSNLDRTVHSVPREATRKGQSYTFREGTFARHGSDAVSWEDLYLSESTPVEKTHTVWDDEILMQKQDPALAPGVIDTAERIDWEQVPPLAWTLHTFTDARRLSELLDPLLARIHTPLGSINGWPATVVDVRHPDRVTDYARLWLDLESGLPLQIDTYQALPWPKLRHTERISEVSLLQLPTGAWLPIKAQRIQYRTVPQEHERVSGMAVDCQSIVTDVNIMDPALFSAPFRSGERIYNAITDRFERYTPPDETPAKHPTAPGASTRRDRQPHSGPAIETPQDMNTIPEANTSSPRVPESLAATPVPAQTDPLPNPAQTTRTVSAPAAVPPSNVPTHRFMPLIILVGAGALGFWWTYRRGA